MIAVEKTAVAVDLGPASFAIRSEHAADAAAREALLDACFGSNRHARICQRLRDGRIPAKGLSFSAVRRGALSGKMAARCLADPRRDDVGNFQKPTSLVGSVRLWHVSAGGVPALMLGPLAVDPSCRNLGVGGALVQHALATATARRYGAVLLLGDEPYYARFGFSALKTAELLLPGPFERDRLLGLELREGALDGACGLIVPTGEAAPRPTATLPGKPRKLAAHAA